MTARRLTLTLLALLLAAIGWSSTAGTAYAGGPTSVLLVNPGGGQAGALYHSSPDYQRLVDAIDAYGSDLGSTDRPDSVSENANDAYRLTWLIHDMSIWRIDRIYSTDDGLWLETLADETGADLFARPGRWHRVAHPEALTAVLTSTGLTDEAAPQTETGSGAEPSTAAATTSAPARTGGEPIALAAGIAGIAGVIL